MFDNIKHNPLINVVTNKSEEDVRYYFDWDSPTLFPIVNLKASDGMWWEPETIEQDKNITL